MKSDKLFMKRATSLEHEKCIDIEWDQSGFFFISFSSSINNFQQVIRFQFGHFLRIQHRSFNIYLQKAVQFLNQVTISIFLWEWASQNSHLK